MIANIHYSYMDSHCRCCEHLEVLLYQEHKLVTHTVLTFDLVTHAILTFDLVTHTILTFDLVTHTVLTFDVCLPQKMMS